MLRDINLKIASGETIGILGGTGSCQLHAGAAHSRVCTTPARAAVLVGGRGRAQITIMETLRDAVAMVLREERAVLRFDQGKPALGRQCRRERRGAGAGLPAGAGGRVHPVASRMGMTPTSSRAAATSPAASSQRLCIARALLKKPKILILDDSTSAVDTRTDALIRKAFREDIPNTTKLIISQRISSIEDADRIIVMNDCKICGIGTHDELLKSNAIYQEVYETQKEGGR